MPNWAKLAVYGAIVAVAVDYFLSPTLQNALKLNK